MLFTTSFSATFCSIVSTLLFLRLTIGALCSEYSIRLRCFLSGQRYFCVVALFLFGPPAVYLVQSLDVPGPGIGLSAIANDSIPLAFFVMAHIVWLARTSGLLADAMAREDGLVAAAFMHRAVKRLAISVLVRWPVFFAALYVLVVGQRWPIRLLEIGSVDAVASGLLFVCGRVRQLCVARRPTVWTVAFGDATRACFGMVLRFSVGYLLCIVPLRCELDTFALHQWILFASVALLGSLAFAAAMLSAVRGGDLFIEIAAIQPSRLWLPRAFLCAGIGMVAAAIESSLWTYIDG